MPRVSALIAVRNGAAEIERALRSIEGQAFRDFETIVADDGSTDGTSEVVARFPWVRLIRQENRGIGATRQRLVHEAGGEWIAFLDHDDEWTQDCLQRLTQAATGECVLVHGNYDIRYPDGRTESVRWIPAATACVLDHLVPDNHVSTCATMIRREAMLRAGFPEDLSRSEDWLAWFRVAAEGDFVHVSEPVAVIHKRTRSASTPDFAWYQGERHVLQDHVLPNLDRWYARVAEGDRARIRALIVRKLGVLASLEAECLDATGDRQGARTRHLEALRTAPTRGAVLRLLKHLVRR